MKIWILIVALGLAGCNNHVWGIYEPESWGYYCYNHHGLTPGDAKHTECMNHYYGQWAQAELARPFMDGYGMPGYPPPWIYDTGPSQRPKLTVCDHVGGQVVCF